MRGERGLAPASTSRSRSLGKHNLTRAKHHDDIVARFGRFPHRNLILGREMTREEWEYLENGGHQG